jgi:hypothetical protein
MLRRYKRRKAAERFQDYLRPSASPRGYGRNAAATAVTPRSNEAGEQVLLPSQ